MDREAYENAHAQHRATRRDGGTYVPHKHRYDPAESAGCLECGELVPSSYSSTCDTLLRADGGLKEIGEAIRALGLLRGEPKKPKEETK